VTEGELLWFPTLALVAAALLFLVEGALAVALAAASALSRVALRRLGTENGEKLAFVESLRETGSVHRIAAHLGRQLALLGATGWLVVGLDAAGWSHPVGSGVTLAALIGVLGFELGLARLLAVWNPRAALRLTAFLVRWSRAVLFPLVQPTHRLLLKIGGLQTTSDEQRDEEQDEEVEALIEVGEREGLLEANEGEMMRSIVDLDETVAREIMTPRPDIVALPVDTGVDEARRVFLRAGHSRLPVYNQSLDEIVGVLHVRDLLRAGDENEGGQPISRYVREAMFVPETLSVADLLSEMRLKTHIALVVDEYGGTAGLVTIEDLLEEIVGEIREEHEPDETEVRHERDGSWLINGAVHVEKLNELFGVEFEERDFDTVGGLVVSQLGRVPRQGESVVYRTLTLEVLAVDGRRIRLVRARCSPASENARAQS
jgi:CBS domain containing-hemolysin-like protein